MCAKKSLEGDNGTQEIQKEATTKEEGWKASKVLWLPILLPVWKRWSRIVRIWSPCNRNRSHQSKKKENRAFVRCRVCDEKWDTNNVTGKRPSSLWHSDLQILHTKWMSSMSGSIFVVLVKKGKLFKKQNMPMLVKDNSIINQTKNQNVHLRVWISRQTIHDVVFHECMNSLTWTRKHNSHKQKRFNAGPKTPLPAWHLLP